MAATWPRTAAIKTSGPTATVRVHPPVRELQQIGGGFVELGAAFGAAVVSRPADDAESAMRACLFGKRGDRGSPGDGGLSGHRQPGGGLLRGGFPAGGARPGPDHRRNRERNQGKNPSGCSRVAPWARGIIRVCDATARRRRRTHPPPPPSIRSEQTVSPTRAWPAPARI